MALSPLRRRRLRRTIIVAASLVALIAVLGVGSRTDLFGVLDRGGAGASDGNDAKPQPPASRIVTSGNARFEVLSPTLIRTEYAAKAAFVDAATYNVVGRDDFSAVDYTTRRADGWLTIDTGSMQLRYHEGTGTFHAENLRLTLTTASGQKVSASPWGSTTAEGGSTCAFGAVCEAEDSTLAGGARASTNHDGYAGAGFVSALQGGASATMRITDVPQDAAAAVQLRYSNGSGRSLAASVRIGDDTATVSLPPTSGWDYWRTVSVPVTAAAGDDSVRIGCVSGRPCGAILDSVAVASASSALLAPHAALGGYRRDLDLVDGQPDTNPGLLYQDGWALLNDSSSDLYDVDTEKLTARDHVKGDRDGYVFAYGTDYERGLGDLATLTGPSELLPRWTYGVWYSEYYDRTQKQLTSIVATARDEGVPLDVLAIDTDYKSPDRWNGWEVDTGRFPDLKGLLADLKKDGVHNTLNVHPSISSNDPQLAAAQKTAGNDLARIGSDYVFDWSQPDELQAYKDLHSEIGSAGVDSWWLDWCCTLPSSTYSASGVTPDAFINGQYADWTADAVGGRGFAFARAYGSLSAGHYGAPTTVPTGPWADKRTTIHFTGDTISTWDTLAAEVGYTPGESASTGLSAVSHDIGGFKDGSQRPGAEAGSTQLPGDLYARWVQLGAFQPIDRLHGHHSDRLPWQYAGAAGASATSFLQLRERLVPLTYTLAAEAESTGVPVVRPLYLEYPDEQEAYARAGSEYLYGSDVLVAPVTTPGTSATTSVWFPPGGDWTDWFTGKTYAGGTTARVTTGLDAMPVFTRSGGIVPTRTDDVANDSTATLDAVTLTVATGADGAFDLFEDDGTTADRDASATTHLAYREADAGGTLTIAAPTGSFDGRVTSRAWTVAFTDVAAPASVSVDGSTLPESGWTYDAGTRTLTVALEKRPTSEPTTVAFTR